MERGRFLKLLGGLTIAEVLLHAVGAIPVSASEEKRVLLLRGYGDQLNEPWYERAREFCGKRGFSLEMLATPHLTEAVPNEENRRRNYFETIHMAVTRDDVPKYIYGVSAGGGGLQMYLDQLFQQYGFPTDGDGHQLIRQMGFLSSRNLYSSNIANYLANPNNYNNPEFNDEFAAIPRSLRRFYRGLPIDSISAAQERGIQFKVRFGTDDVQVPPRNSSELGSLLGIEAKSVRGGHMVVSDSEVLLDTIIAST